LNYLTLYVIITIIINHVSMKYTDILMDKVLLRDGGSIDVSLTNSQLIIVVEIEHMKTCVVFNDVFPRRKRLRWRRRDETV